MSNRQMAVKEHFVYRWTHEHGYYYIGKHSGTEDDGYIGSGILFKKFRELLKDGWTREVLTKHATSDLALQSEKRIVGDRWKTDVKSLNLCPGGRIHQRAMVGYYKEKLIRLALANLKDEL